MGTVKSWFTGTSASVPVPHEFKFVGPDLSSMLWNKQPATYLQYLSTLALTEAVLMHLYAQLELGGSGRTVYGDQVRCILEGCTKISQMKRRVYRWYRAHGPNVATIVGVSIQARREADREAKRFCAIDSVLGPEGLDRMEDCGPAWGTMPSPHTDGETPGKQEDWWTCVKEAIESNTQIRDWFPGLDDDAIAQSFKKLEVPVLMPEVAYHLNTLLKAPKLEKWLDRNHPIRGWTRESDGRHPKYGAERHTDETALKVLFAVVQPWLQFVVQDRTQINVPADPPTTDNQQKIQDLVVHGRILEPSHFSPG